MNRPIALRELSVTLAAVLCLQASVARAHWCDDLWGSSYNLVVQPESDGVAVAQDGTATLRLYVQNNMAYPLPDFAVEASAPGYAIHATMGSTKVRGMLMPGERIAVLLDVSSTTGATMAAENLVFHVHFGHGRQADRYPTAPGRAAVVLGVDGGILPAGDSFPGIGTGNAEARDLQYAALADFGDTARGIDSLLQFYCAGRASWDHGSARVLSSYCLDAEHAQCPGRASFQNGEHTTLYDWPKLWAAQHLAARKVVATNRLPVFRQRLMCGYADDNPPFRAMAAVLLGYLGEDAAARTFLEEKIRSAVSDDQLVAKAALLLLGRTDDQERYREEVRQGIDADDPYVAGACAAVLGIVDGDDLSVQEVLMKRATWTEPELANNGRGFYNAHLLALVALHRSHWAPDSAGSSYASFFSGETIEQPPPSATVAPPDADRASGCRCTTGGRTVGPCGLPVAVFFLVVCAWRRLLPTLGRRAGAWMLTAAAISSCACNSAERRARHFNDYARDVDSQPGEVLARLGIVPGMQIADVGAGGGYFALAMARAVGNTGRVFAVDIDAGLLEFISHDAAEVELANVQIVLASENDSRLPDASTDLVFMRDTFHHLRDPTAYFRQLTAKLRPNARVAIVDYRPDGLWAWLFGHHASRETIERHMASAGYVVDRSYDFLARQCFVIFRHVHQTPREQAVHAARSLRLP